MTLNLMDKIGEGSYGIVYKVRRNGKNYALKMEKQSNSLTNEINVLKKLKHQSIPTLLEYKQNFILIDLYKISFYKISQINPNYFTYKKICDICNNILCILEYIHSQNLVYCDIKPENIMLGFDDKIYLIDFGLTAKYGEKVKALRGTARYASINAHKLKDPHYIDDVEGLGYVLIYLHTLNLPWGNINPKRHKQIEQLKESIKIEDLAVNTPFMMEYLLYVRNYKTGEIDYENLRKSVTQNNKITKKVNWNTRLRNILKMIFCCC